MEKRTRWPHHLTGSAAGRPAHALDESVSASSRVSQPLAGRQVVGWFLGVGLIALVLFGPGTFWLIRMEIRQRQLDRQLAQLKATREQLAAEEARLRNDPAYVEGLIRTTFKVARPDELVIPLEGEESQAKAR